METMVELSENEMLNIDGGNLFGNLMIAAGSVCLCAATGPAGWIVGGACAVIGLCESQGW